MQYNTYDEYRQYIKSLLDCDVSDHILDGVLAYVFSIIDFKASIIDEIYHGNGTPKLFLKFQPLHTVESVKIDGDILDPSLYKTVSDMGFLFLPSSTRPRGYSNIEVSYTAGYNPIPGAITSAILALIKQETENNKSAGISSESIDDYRIVFDKTTSPEIKKVLLRYKKYHV